MEIYLKNVISIYMHEYQAMQNNSGQLRWDMFSLYEKFVRYTK